MKTITIAVMAFWFGCGASRVDPVDPGNRGEAGAGDGVADGVNGADAGIEDANVSENSGADRADSVTFAEGGSDASVESDADTGDALSGDAGEDGPHCPAFGQLRITYVPPAPTCDQVVMGTPNVELARYRFEAEGERVDLPRIPVHFNLWDNDVLRLNSFRNIRLIDTTGRTWGDEPYVDEHGYTEVRTYMIVEPGEPQEVLLTVDANSYALGAVSGTRFKAGIVDTAPDGSYSFVAIGFVSGECGGRLPDDRVDLVRDGEEPDGLMYGPERTIYRTALSMDHAPDAPRDLSYPNVEQMVGKLEVQNTPSEEAYDGTVQTLNIRFDSSIVTTEPRNVRVYRDSFEWRNLIARAVIPPGVMIGEVEIPVGEFDDVYVVSGANRILDVTVDTRDAMPGDWLTIYVGGDGHLIWSDGVSTGIEHTCSNPDSSRTITY